MSQTSEINRTGNEGSQRQSEDEKNIMPDWAKNLLSETKDIGAKYMTYQQFTSKLGTIDKAVGILSASDIDLSQRLNNFVEFQRTSSSVLSDDCMMKRCGVRVDHLVTSTSKMSPEAAEKFQRRMLQSLDDIKYQMADHFIYTSCVVSVGFLVMQIWKLISVWKEIKNAENLHKDETQFLEIEQNIEAFKEMCERLQKSIHDQEIDDIMVDSVELHEKYTDIYLLINGLKVRINGVMERLNAAENSQIYDGMSNVLTAGNNFIHLMALFNSASSPAKIAAGTLITASASLSLFNIGAYFMTEKRLNELRGDLRQLHQYEAQVKKIYADIKKVLKDRNRRR